MNTILNTPEAVRMRRQYVQKEIPFSLRRELQTALHVLIGTTSELDPLIECNDLDTLCKYSTLEEIAHLVGAERKIVASLLPNHAVTIWYTIEYNYKIVPHYAISLKFS